MNSTDIQMIVDQLEDQLRNQLDECPCVKADELGLDPRCGRAFVGDDCLIVESNYQRTFDYYGGFEYVDKEMIQPVGRYVVYYAGHDDDSCRVREAINMYNGVYDDEEEMETV